MSTADPVAATPWNPLDYPADEVTEDDRLSEARRSVENILESYHRNYDLFAELLQNAVDACEQRWLEEGEAYGNPSIWVTLRLGSANEITVCDNGVGMTASQFARAVRPNTSFKDYRHRPGTARDAGSQGRRPHLPRIRLQLHPHVHARAGRRPQCRDVERPQLGGGRERCADDAAD